MDLKSVSLRNTRYLGTIRWGVASLATVVAAAMYVPASTAQVVVGEGVLARPGAVLVGSTGGFSGGKWGNPKTDGVAIDVYGANQAALDPGSLYTVGKAIGARGVWAKTDASGRQLTGQGVSVAVLDSGVSPVNGFDVAGKVTYGPDLSIEANGVLTQQDAYGHGTFMAGIIAGRGTTGPSSGLATAPANVQLGVAPDAKILALKLATSDGSADVSQVIAALDWVTQHPVLPDGTRVRVINLSYGTNSAQGYLADPLAAAAENAWRHGIVVVTSAGNNGLDYGRLTDPATDPYVIAVGAADSNDSVNGWGSKTVTVAAFSAVGTTTRHVDLVAPGTSLVSARAPGSYVDVNNPSGLVSGDVGGTLFRGSGTSQAAAVVSGSVALLLQAHPNLTPDQVKYALTSSAVPVHNGTVTTVGAGTLNLTKALETAGHMAGNYKDTATLLTAAVQSFPSSTGQGSIEGARGGSVLVDAAGNDLTGEVDVQGNTWDPAAWWQATSTLTSWSGGRWLGVTWAGDDWAPDSGGLTSSRWSSSRWSSSRWSTADWSSSTWSSARWSSSRWSSSRWSALDWF